MAVPCFEGKAAGTHADHVPGWLPEVGPPVKRIIILIKGRIKGMHAGMYQLAH